MIRYFFLLLIVTLLPVSNNLTAVSRADPLIFDDAPLQSHLTLPNWFKVSFLDLNENLQEANENNRGLIIYFERKNCAYCKAQLEVNWGKSDIVEYTKKNFDVIAIDVKGNYTVTDFDGTTYSENNYAAKMKTDFTPSFLIYDKQGQLALKLYGFRPPYQFRAALEYAIDNHHKRESFNSYLARAEAAMSFGQEELNDNDVFLVMDKVTNLDRTRTPGEKPLAVFFEHPKCHACDVLHAGPMNETEIIRNLMKMDVVQINTSLDKAIITPTGEQLTNKQWANKLQLTFAPAIIFFDNNGNEIIRIESVVRFNRLNNVLQYVLEDGHISYPTFQRWRESKPYERR